MKSTAASAKIIALRLRRKCGSLPPAHKVRGARVAADEDMTVGIHLRDRCCYGLRKHLIPENSYCPPVRMVEREPFEARSSPLGCERIAPAGLSRYWFSVILAPSRSRPKYHALSVFLPDLLALPS